MSNEPLTIEGMKRIIIEIIDFWCIKNCSDHSDSICNCVANQATIIAFLDELEFLRKYIASEKVEANNKKLRAAAESDHHEHEKMLAEHAKLIERVAFLEGLPKKAFAQGYHYDVNSRNWSQTLDAAWNKSDAKAALERKDDI